MASELVKRLIAANENGSLMGSDIFYKAAERIDVLEKAICVMAREELGHFVFEDDDECIEFFIQLANESE